VLYLVFAIVVVAWPVLAHEIFFMWSLYKLVWRSFLRIFTMACSPPGDVLIALRIIFSFLGYMGSDGMCGFFLRESDPLQEACGLIWRNEIIVLRLRQCA
jgi:hypothetical protein